MHRVRLLFILGAAYFGFCFAFFYTLRQLVIPQVIWLPANGANNDFVFQESQYCRPFLQSQNPQVVRVSYQYRPRTGAQERIMGCSGVIVGPQSVLTAKHCTDLDGGRLVRGLVTTSLGDTFEVKRRHEDPDEDIVLLFVDKPFEIQPATVAAQVPMALTLEGYGCAPVPLTWPLKRQAIALAQHDHILFLAGCVCHGDSGGPIFDDDGSLVGLMFWTENDGKNGRGVLVQDFMKQQASDHIPSRTH